MNETEKKEIVKSTVEYAVESRNKYDLETYLPMTEDYDSEVNEFIKRLSSSIDDENYKIVVEELIDYYLCNYDDYKDQFE